MTITPLKSSYRPDVKITSLGPKIGDSVKAANFPQHMLRWRNDRWAQTIGLDKLNDQEWIEHFGAFKPLQDNLPQPMAMRYHGHQFRTYNPQIGDGRGFLFAQMRDHEGRLIDLATKGSGQTPYSREGDGRLTLKGAVRELLATEWLEALGVNTSKSFSIIETGEELWRNDEPSPTRSAVLVRQSHSHIRFGTFQRIAFEDDAEMMQSLVTYCLSELYNVEPRENAAAQLLHLAVERIADLAASYMVAGFVHGVLNTDNINITGESFDYGPWRFTPYWEPQFTAAYFDQSGLYSFGRQPEALHWNLGQLAVSLRLISDAELLIAALERFPTLYQNAIIKRFLWRLNIKSQGEEKDRLLVQSAETAMIKEKIIIDEFFMLHNGGKINIAETQSEAYKEFLNNLDGYVPENTDISLNINDDICSMHIEEVEDIWSAIADNDDWNKLYSKVEQIRSFGNQLLGK